MRDREIERDNAPPYRRGIAMQSIDNEPIDRRTRSRRREHPVGENENNEGKVGKRPDAWRKKKTKKNKSGGAKWMTGARGSGQFE